MRLTRTNTVSAILTCVALMFMVCFYHITSQFDLRNHKWLILYNLRQLPGRDTWLKRGFMNGRRTGITHDSGPLFVDKHVPGNQTAVNPGGGSVKSHTILLYNKPDIYVLDFHNKFLQKSACPYKNCHFTDQRSMLGASTGVIFSLSHGPPMGTTPPRKYPGQVWVFTDIEPPIINNAFDHRHHNWDNTMNWSMTYRVDSDIVKSFAVLEELPPAQDNHESYRQLFRAKTGFAAWPVSNCGSDVTSSRYEFAKELQKYIPVDIFGKCGTMELDRVNSSAILARYKFFFAFENSFCLDYVSEKFYDNYNTDTIIVVRGAADYDRLLPKDTFINSRHFHDAKSLAMFLKKLNSSEEAYTQFLARKNKYRFKLKNWECDLCSKLNNKDTFQRTYPSIPEYWHDDVCHVADDIQVTCFHTLKEVFFLFVVLVIMMYIGIRWRVHIYIKAVLLMILSDSCK